MNIDHEVAQFNQANPASGKELVAVTVQAAGVPVKVVGWQRAWEFRRRMDRRNIPTRLVTVDRCVP